MSTVSRSATRSTNWRRDVVALTILVAAAAVAVWWMVEAFDLAPARSLPMPWWLMVAAFVATDATEIHYEYRGQSQALTLSEVTLLIGLVALDPADLLVARLLASAGVGVLRQSLPKVVFNVAQQALNTGVALAVFALVASTHPAVSPHGWLASALAIGAADVVALVCVLAAIGVTVGLPDRHGLTPMLRGFAMVAVTNVHLGLITLLVLSVHPWAGLLLLLPVVLLVVLYRSFRMLRQRHDDLATVHCFTNALGLETSRDDIVTRALVELCRVLQVEHAAVAFGRGDSLEHEQATAGGEELVRLARQVVEDGDLIAPRGRSGGDARLRSLDGVYRDVLAVRVRNGGDLGVLAVANRLGEVSSFQRGDIGLLQLLGDATASAVRSAALFEQVRAEAATRRYQAHHDPVTGLANRALLAESLNEALRQRANEEQLAVFLLDLDHFKDVNDSLGHHVGDEVLREIGHRLQAALVRRAVVARLGGDEFAVVATGVTSAREVDRLAAEIAMSVALPVHLPGDLSLEMTASVGFVTAPDQGDDFHTLLQRADVAMYIAKSDRSGIACYDVRRDNNSPRRLTLAADLRAAIDGDEMSVVYQPQFDLDEHVVGAELLVRWRHPEFGPVSPDEFIPIAERTGLVRPLTRYVLAAGIHQLARWRDDGFTIGLSVNISAQDLLAIGLIDEVRALLNATGIDPTALTLELTETAAMSDVATGTSVLTRLAEIGVRLAVDDFGTGHSSLARLRSLPVSEVKIDRSFVMAMTSGTADRAIVRSTIQLARNLGCLSVAEGVEDTETLEALRAEGCDRVQGYLLSPPLGADEFGALLARTRVESRTGA